MYHKDRLTEPKITSQNMQISALCSGNSTPEYTYIAVVVSGSARPRSWDLTQNWKGMWRTRKIRSVDKKIISKFVWLLCWIMAVAQGKRWKASLPQLSRFPRLRSTRLPQGIWRKTVIAAAVMLPAATVHTAASRNLTQNCRCRSCHASRRSGPHGCLTEWRSKRCVLTTTQ